LKALLVYPPGWNLLVGSPYLSLGLLGGRLHLEKIAVELLDLNISSAKYFDVFISETDLRDKNYDNTYLAQQAKLNKIAQKYNGNWSLQQGFSFDNLNVFSSSVLKNNLDLKSPFYQYYSFLLSTKDFDNYTHVLISISDSTQFLHALQFINYIKKAGYKGKIIVGGNYITRIKNELKQDWVFDLIDYIIYFQGEDSLIKLLKNYPLASISNIIYKDTNVIVDNNTCNKTILHPIEKQIPYFSDFEMENYWGVKFLPIVHQKGCYHGACKFCAIPYGWGNNGYGGSFSISSVFSTMIKLKAKYKIHNFQFVDESFPLSSANKLSSLIIENNIEFNWEIFARLERGWLNNKLLQKLSQSGLKKVHFGLEIISSRRNILNKNDTITDYIQLLELFAKNNIKVHFFIMVGFPGTDLFDGERTIEFVLNNKDVIDTIDLNPFTFYKYTLVEGIKPFINKKNDLALEFEYIRNQDRLTSTDVELYCRNLESKIKVEKNNLLHPIYRMISPWSKL
jgi:radical SAM superfamily enzyme YgiQ (UPF0313 family)